MDIESVWETAYEVGVNAGIKQIENKIQEYCEMGKPILINGELYWLKDSKQHLIEIIDSLEYD